MPARTIRRRLAAAGAFVIFGMGSSLLGATGAGADPSALAIRKVDTTKFPQVSLTAIAVGGTPDLSKFTLRENGSFVPPQSFNVTPIAKTNTPVGIVLALDVSDGMKTANRFALMKAAAKQFVAQKNPADQVAIVAIGASPTQQIGFTADSAALSAAIDKLALGGSRSEWDAVGFGVGLFDSRPELQKNLVLVTSGKDTSSRINSDSALHQAVNSHTAVFVVALTGKDFEETAPRQLASASGGSFFATGDPNTLAQLANTAEQSLADQYLITYKSTATTPTIDIQVAVGTVTATSTAVSPGTVSEGVQLPQVVKLGGPGFLHSDSLKYVVGLLALVAAGLAAWALLAMSVKEESTLDAAMRPYDEAKPADVADENGRHSSSLASNSLIKRAVGLTGRLAQERGLLERVERKLEEANLPLRAAEAIFFYVAGAVIVTLMALLLKGLFAGIFVLVLAAVGPFAGLNFAVSNRRRKFTGQLPDMLQLLAGTLRAGYSLMQGVEAAADEVEDPIGHELRRVIGEARLGRPLEEALEDCASRMQSDDFSWAVMAIGIQREVGGNLAELLMTVSQTMVARDRLRRDVKALTAEGRISAIVLGLLPVGLGVVMYTINPKYMGVLFHDPFGQAMLGGAIIVAAFGFWWMKKTIEIEV